MVSWAGEKCLTLETLLTEIFIILSWCQLSATN
ncbi:hypothetical protein GDO86_018345 [Hymenochirus boettgeri]|uniref:Uncharacterized protein n=1 Tax=Hymenochirus boettgeri TaxID=247094 RepID=A0A8T2IHW6_9PIPI|nr:hypothetical protein GDO86_018345 [Hymenochirus boettgeri]